MKIAIKAVFIFILFLPALLAKDYYFPDTSIAYEFLIFVVIMLIVNGVTLIIDNIIDKKKK